MRFGACGVLLGAALAFGSACSPKPAAVPAKAAPEAPTLHDGPLTDYVPSAGLRWMVVGRPKEIARDPVLAKAIGLLLPEERLAAFTKSSGVELAKTSEGLIAAFDHATLYMASTPHGSPVRERFSERLLTDPTVKKPHPRILRVTGVVGETPETLVHIDGKLAAVAVGSSIPARVTELYALGKLRSSPPAFRGAALSALPLAELERAPARFYAPGPFSGDWARGARGLLLTTTAVGLSVAPSAQGKLALTLVLAGDYRADDRDPAELLRQTWEDLASSNLGRLLGLDTVAAPPLVSASPDSLRFSVELDPVPLAQGLRAAVMAEVWEILRLEPPPGRDAPSP